MIGSMHLRQDPDALVERVNDSSVHWNRADWAAVGVLSAIWVAACFLVDPRGNFPLNDDWSYAAAVRTLLDHHRLELTDFTSMPLVAQVLWGALFCLPFGFSFDALRVSTLVLGLVGVVSTYALVRTVAVSADRSIAWLCGLVILVNPVYLCLAHSFMTDVPFFAVTTLTLALSARWLQGPKPTLDVATVTLVITGGLIRQLAITTAAAIALAVGSCRPTRFRRLAIAPTIMAAAWAVPFAWRHILLSTTGLPTLYDRPFADLRASLAMPMLYLLRHTLLLTLISSLYVGLFLAPLILAATPQRTAGHSKTRFVPLLETIVAIGVMLVLLIARRRMPLWGDQLKDVSVGPDYLTGILPTVPFAAIVWIPLTAISVVAAVRLARYLMTVAMSLLRRWSMRSNEDQVLLMLLAFGVFYTAPLFIGGVLLDRYLLVILPVLMAVTAAASLTTPRIGRLRASVILALPVGLFSIAATHDYLALNRARWEALRDATTIFHVAASDLDGGREFNGWSAYRVGEHRRGAWWDPVGQTWVVSLSPLPNFDMLREYSYARWLPGNSTLFLLRQRRPSQKSATN